VTEVHTQVGRYRILEILGQGAMGVVYRARDETLERDVALKLMSLSLGADPDARMRFKREAQSAARLQHPNIVTIYELGEHEGTPFIAMELLTGLDLQQAIQAGLRPDPKVSLPIVLQLLAGLSHAHEHGIVHRDVKPSNLFLPRGRPAKIMDFGVARLAASGMTTAGMVVGTPSYMSPEQVRAAPLDGRSDLFSAGLILYELITGEKAYRADSVVGVLYKIAHDDPDLALLPSAAEWKGVRDVLVRALARDADERYPDAGAMSAELLAVLRKLGGSAEWDAPSDLGLLSRATPKPTAQSLTLPPEPANATAARRALPLMAGRRGQVIGGLGALLVLALVGAIGWLRPAGSKPTAAPVVASLPPTTLPAPGPTPAPVTTLPPKTPPPPTLTPSTALAASPGDRALPASPLPDGTQTAPEPPAGTARVDHADQQLQQGHYAAALAEARAILAKDRANAEAKTIAEEAEAALVVEDHIRKAREALKRGDREGALEHVKAGFLVNANDKRLMDLWRELTH
jgi:serine/threonine protein kinase